MSRPTPQEIAELSREISGDEPADKAPPDDERELRNQLGWDRTQERHIVGDDRFFE